MISLTDLNSEPGEKSAFAEKHRMDSNKLSLALIIGLAGFKLALHLTSNLFFAFGYFRDEFYYMACGEHLAFGYVDHPPLIALISASSRAIFGDSLVAIRFLPALAGAGTVVLTILTVRELGGRLFAQALAGLAVIGAPVYLVTSNMLSTVPFDHFFWALTLYLVVVLLKSGNARLWLAIGGVVGIGLLTKNNMTFLAIGLAGSLLLTSNRKYLKSPWLWAGVLLAGLLVSPYLLWEFQNGFPTLEFTRNASSQKNAEVNPLAFFLQQVLAVNPISAPLWLAGLGYLLTSRVYRLLGLTYLLTFGVFAATQAARPDYLTPIYPILLAAGATWLEQLTLQRRWGRVLSLGLMVVGLMVVLPTGLPLLSPATTASITQAMGLSSISLEKGNTATLPQYFADMFGWPELTVTIATVYNQLTPEERARTTIITGNYGEAGALNLLGKAYKLPIASSGHNNYWLWGAANPAADIVIVVGYPGGVAEMRQYFTSFEQVNMVKCKFCIDYQNDRPVFVGKGLNTSLAELWPKIKRFI